MTGDAARGGPIVIIGGGVIGTSIAFHLAERGYRDVTVAERGLPGEGATARATGGIRQQFTSRINAELARRSVDFFRAFSDRTGAPLDFRQHGYLFLITDPAQLTAFRDAAAMQNELGIPTEIITAERARDLVPSLRTDDVAGASYCATDGSASPADAVAGFAAAARRGGVTILQHAPVTAIERDADGHVRGVLAGGRRLPADIVVIAAGPQTAEVGRLAGACLPVEPHRRQAFAIAPMDWLKPEMPLTVDLASGAYVHPGVSGGVIGGTDRHTPVGTDTAVDWSGLEPLIAALAGRIPAMADARVTRGWAGLREMTPDDHAIVGPVPEAGGLWVAAGFSGHGFMQAPAVGQAVSDWLLDGSPGLDMTPLCPGRFSQHVSGREQVVF
ncbi:MAG TPA: FAD-binding oxidoreductase [Streptosporangiaceae bacterium]|nr:FAD-binding oxidoreductase [Streptosporangiaceae bacterium]